MENDFCCKSMMRRSARFRRSGRISWLLIRAQKKHFGPNHYTAVEIVGLFWHVVDIVWIFLFPLLYLINRHLA